MTPLDLVYVDDDPDIRTIAVLSLRLDPAVKVRSAASGTEALALFDATPDWRPDAVLLDVMMPEMDGPAVAQAIRGRPGLETIPVIFMTARSRESDVESFLRIGRAAVIAKPFDPLGLVDEVRAKLREIGTI